VTCRGKTHVTREADIDDQSSLICKPCLPTLSEVRQLSVNILAAQRLSGKILTGHTPCSAGMLTVLRWSILWSITLRLGVSLGCNHRCARLVDLLDILKPRNSNNSDYEELQRETCIYRERAWYVLWLQIFDPPSTQGSLAHDFCGRRCAEQFNKNGQRIFQSRSPTANSDLCTIPGCPKSVYVSADGSKSKFCSIRHRT
jgi:hypothetical protein